ncbi:DUF3780 and DUF4357 domain-containing protein [Lelliottia sp. V106_10]|uniref:anti-phage-associated DUF3780 domain-containing protein n=1 Tax=Lelliottia wanjuensis TaxID=3050585 RepID=UPI0025515517|nr:MULTISPECIES: anti-phage-associated DUF3780 domain-containing protein [unclassified Lelliottia]MDK9358940.1 DUF3780 and DUF4357 domain-containing protein [Lelliottia sp. V106_16]MDK9373628.1 DUF3780 and DUF4357 domain-containing protein [Lelliottia sp. V106_10]MDK9600332.1 DUF3780 and DUF4357 domain-containing protein [Lelliottia sp. V106_5]
MAKAQLNITTTSVKHQTLGFGVPASSDPHHFKVIIPKSSTGKVQISEYLGLQAQREEFSIVDRVHLDRTRWAAIRAEVQRAFNTRLKSYGLKTSSWQVGENMLDRLLGKEICVLAWAIESMEIDNIPVAVRNWLALSPEERWWLFGMTAKSTGGVDDRDVGWRIALRHALGDIVQTEQIQFSQDSTISDSRDVSKPYELKEPSAIYGDFRTFNHSGLLSQDTIDNESLYLDGSNSHVSNEPTPGSSNEDESLFLFEVKLAKAIGQPVGERSSPEFLIKKGSTANIALAKSLRPAIRDLRKKLLDDGILIKRGDVYSFEHEYQFKSPSAAACVIAGNPRSGMDAWRDLQGRSLKELGYGKKL